MDKKDSKKMAKMEALKELRKMAMDSMSDDMGSMEKLTIAAKDKEGLKEGLEKAEEMLEKKKDEDDD